MKFMRLGIYFFAASFIFLTACQSGGGGVSKNITGRAGEIVVVVNEDVWEGNVGSIVRNSLAQEHVALPQDEPLFDLIPVPRDAFTNVFRTTRNILQVRISSNIDSVGVAFQENIWASPQAVVTIQAKNEQEFNDLYQKSNNKIISFFLKAERDRLFSNYSKYHESGIYNVLNENFGVTMNVAPGFQIAEQKDDFIWLRYETPEVAQGIILFSYPFVSDSAFTIDYQLAIRDSLLKANIPGPTEGSYMATERRLSQIHNITKHNGNYAAEMRGLWRLMNDYMGGPYVSLAQLDFENQRVVTAFGYVYAPGKDKRNLLRQVEAMIYSTRLNNQKNNDILNRQLSLGE